jgi:hypothetical protein
MSSSTLDLPQAELSHVGAGGVIGGKLSALRRRVTLWFLVDGLCLVMLVLLLIIAVDLLVDRQFSMDRPQRIVVLGLAAIAMATVVYRRLLRPLMSRPSDDALCLMVERRHRELGEGLISAVQLSREQEWERLGMSPGLVATTIRHGVEAAKPLDFGEVLRGRRFVINSILAGLLLLAVAGVAWGVKRTETMSIWFDRNVLLSDRPWPQDYYLSFVGAEDGVLHIPRAEAWPVAVNVRLARDEVLPPEEVFLEVRGAVDHSERMERGDGGRHFSAKLPVIDGTAQVRAVAEAGTTPWLRIDAVERPQVASLSLSVTPPKYAGGQRETLAEGRGPYAILPGSKVQINGTASKALSQVAISRDDWRHKISPRNGNQFTTELDYAPDKGGTYSIELTDTEQLPFAAGNQSGPLGSRLPVQFTLRTRVDRLPIPKLRLKGIGGLITTRALLPMSLSVDDDFAVKDAWIQLHYRTAVEGDAGEEVAVRPDGIKPQLGKTTVRLEHPLDVAALKAAEGTDLILEIQAIDNNDVTPPRRGTSGATVLRVVSDEEFRSDLLRREKEQRQEIERLQKVLVGIIADTRELTRKEGDNAPTSAKVQQSVASVAREQKRMGAALSVVARRIDELLTEATNNGLERPDGPLAQRLRSRVSVPLGQIAERSVPNGVLKLDEARRLVEKVDERNVALEAALDGQSKIAADLSDILKNMIKAEDYQLVLSLIMELQHSQEDVLKRAEKERQERIKQIFQQGKSDGKQE